MLLSPKSNRNHDLSLALNNVLLMPKPEQNRIYVLTLIQVIFSPNLTKIVIFPKCRSLDTNPGSGITVLHFKTPTIHLNHLLETAPSYINMLFHSLIKTSLSIVQAGVMLSPHISSKQFSNIQTYEAGGKRRAIHERLWIV